VTLITNKPAAFDPAEDVELDDVDELIAERKPTISFLPLFNEVVLLGVVMPI
jgi:hypothetical protein